MEIYIEEYFASLKKGNLIICKFVTTWMNVEDITARETRQSKERQIVHDSLTSRITKRVDS